MIRDRVTLNDVLTVLNRAAELDPVAMGRLLAARVPCNAALAGHPSIQALSREEARAVGLDAEGAVGVLGILNGLFGTFSDGWGAITAVVEADGSVSRFQRTTGHA